MLQAKSTVEEIKAPAPKPEPLVKRKGPEDTVVSVGGVSIGGPGFVVIAGPCSVETPEQLMDTAQGVARHGAHILRGGAFKPRTSPYSFQGLGEEGLQLLARARQTTGLPVITELMDAEDLPLLERYTDIIQIGARNVQNFSLLRKVGQSRKPVLIKRGLMTTIDEFLMAAEYVLAGGNSQVMLCERGIRTFETSTRNTLDLGAVCVLKERTHLPVIVDPSHATGCRRYVGPLARAAMAVGADGLMVEVHCSPETALCDGEQSLTHDDFGDLMHELGSLEGHWRAWSRPAEAAGRVAA